VVLERHRDEARQAGLAPSRGARGDGAAWRRRLADRASTPQAAELTNYSAAVSAGCRDGEPPAV
jgi:hypothetical protein